MRYQGGTQYGIDSDGLDVLETAKSFRCYCRGLQYGLPGCRIRLLGRIPRHCFPVDFFLLFRLFLVLFYKGVFHDGGFKLNVGGSDDAEDFLFIIAGVPVKRENDLFFPGFDLEAFLWCGFDRPELRRSPDRS